MLVRSPEEIRSTLDADGTLHGLPFMPEMLDMCGKPFRVERRAEKTCVDVAPPVYPNRRFADDDVVFLGGLRCDGEAHDGCKRGCKIFWKEAWLRPLESADVSQPASDGGAEELLRRLRTKSDPDHYFCQSTQLEEATEVFPGNKKVWRLRVAIREVRNGDRSAPAIVKLGTLWIWQKVLRRLHGDGWLRGPHVRAPAASLGLEPGDPVRIKSRADLVATLDHHQSNRGMRICYEMTRCCGAQADVDRRLDRIISERTGEMIEIRDTVTLRDRRNNMPLGDQDCLCADETGDCPRGELMYWREIWLERESGGTA